MTKRFIVPEFSKGVSPSWHSRPRRRTGRAARPSKQCPSKRSYFDGVVWENHGVDRRNFPSGFSDLGKLRERSKFDFEMTINERIVGRKQIRSPRLFIRFNVC